MKGCNILLDIFVFVVSFIKRRHEEVFEMGPIKGCFNGDHQPGCGTGNQGNRDAMLELEQQRRMDDLRRREVK